MPLYAGFVGQNITLQCKSFIPIDIDANNRINWYFQCANCEVVWSSLAPSEMFSYERPHADYLIDFMGGMALVSQTTGNLTILNFQAIAEGLYKCHHAGRQPQIMELKSAGEFVLQSLHDTQYRTNNCSYAKCLNMCRIMISFQPIW